MKSLQEIMKDMYTLYEMKKDLYIQLNEYEEREKELNKDTMNNVDELLRINHIKTALINGIIKINEKLQCQYLNEHQN